MTLQADLSTNETVFQFSDDLFEQSENEDVEKINKKLKRTKIQQQFAPTNHFPLWFVDDSDITDAQTLKYQADFLYYKKDFSKAIKVYEKCAKNVSESNKTLAKDVEESIIWCYLKLRDEKKAKELFQSFHKNLIETSTTAEQTTPSIFLSNQIAQQFGSNTEIQNSLKEFILVHPSCAELWFKLAQTYCHDNHKEVKKAMFCCVRSDWLAQCFVRSSASFSEVKYSELRGRIKVFMQDLKTKLNLSEEHFVKMTTTQRTDEEKLANCSIEIFDDLVFSSLTQ